MKKKTFGEFMLDYRKRNGLTQVHFKRYRDAIARMETRHLRQGPRLDTVTGIASILGLKTHELIKKFEKWQEKNITREYR